MDEVGWTVGSVLSASRVGILALIVGAPGVARGDVWTTHGPDGGFVGVLAVDPSDGTRVFAVAGSRLFKSTDSGATWHVSDVGLTAVQVEAVAVDPVDPSTVYAGAFGGMFKSTDGGDTWSVLPLRVRSNAPVSAIVVLPSDPSTVYVTNFQSGVFRSTDGGEHWTPLTDGLTTLTVEALAVSPSDPNTIYVATAIGGIFKSTDAGATWRSVSNGVATVHIATLAVDPNAADIVYGSTTVGDNVFKTVDGGSSWTPLGIPAHVVAVDPAHPSTVYFGTGDGVFKSTNGGATWFPAYTGMGFTAVFSMALDPNDPDTIYAGTFGDPTGIPVSGVFKSSDGAGTWSAANVGLVAGGVPSVAVDHDTPGTLYAGTGAQGVFKSVDWGATWVPINDGITAFSVEALAIDPNTSSTIYAGTTQGMFKTTDAGRSWVALQNSPDAEVFAIDPSDTTTIYAGTFFGVVKSSDGGSTWRRILAPTYTFFSAVAVDPSRPTTVYAAGNDVGIFKSVDGGATWTPSNGGLADSAAAIVVDPTNSDVVYAATFAHGIFKSTDAGANWVHANDGLGATHMTALAMDPNSPAVLYAAGGEAGFDPTHLQGGVFRTTDGGDTWHAMSFGLEGRAPSALAVDPVDSSRVYAGGRGVFVLEPGSPCGSIAQAVCKHPTEARQSSVRLVRHMASGRSALLWKWTSGAATATPEFGDPRVATEYVVCLYDEIGGISSRALTATAEEGGQCGTRACWAATGTGFAYRNGAGTPNGLVGLTLGASDASRGSRIVLRARGPSLESPTLPLSMSPQATIQLRNSLGSCWEADFTRAVRNSPTRFQAESE